MRKTFFITLLLSAFSFLGLQAQQLTGVWKGRIGQQKAEVKLIQQGDSIRGTSYYHSISGSYRRYSIQGYRDAATNAVVWWDDVLIEERGGLLGASGKAPQASEADFNCPGGGIMMLDGKAGPKEAEKESELHLDKTARTQFPDEWDYVIENYTIGASDPYVIDSIAHIAFAPKKMNTAQPQPAVRKTVPPGGGMVAIPPQADVPEPALGLKAVPPAKPLTIEEKFVARTPKFVMDIPVQGDSVELRFYDNAEIDGDSISLFLNKELLFRHVRLTAKPYIVKLAVASLLENNELVMVAENLGKIPPNTSFMVALVGDKRYEANLQSTEETSALIRLIKPRQE